MQKLAIALAFAAATALTSGHASAQLPQVGGTLPGYATQDPNQRCAQNRNWTREEAEYCIGTAYRQGARRGYWPASPR